MHLYLAGAFFAKYESKTFMKSEMKVIVLSDLNWERHLVSVREEEVEFFSRQMLKMDRYFSIARYYNIIQSEKVNLVLLAGDITGDGSCGHGYHNALKILIKLLNEDRIHVGFIGGNHDEPRYYESVVDYAKKLEYAYDLNNNSTNLLGIDVLGVPYDTSHSKRKLKSIIKKHEDDVYHIVLAHAELKRRIWTLDFNAELVVTGHYDRKLCGIEDKVFVALDNDSNQSSYLTISYHKNQTDLEFKMKENNGLLIAYPETMKALLNNNLTDTLTINRRRQEPIDNFESAEDKEFTSDGSPLHYLKYLRGEGFKMAAEYIRLVKKKPSVERPSIFKQLLNIPITPLFNCTKSMINDYLGKKI